jgi:hypothetical protein
MSGHRKKPKKILTAATEPNGSQVKFCQAMPNPNAESMVPCHHSTCAHYYVVCTHYKIIMSTVCTHYKIIMSTVCTHYKIIKCTVLDDIKHLCHRDKSQILILWSEHRISFMQHSFFLRSKFQYLVNGKQRRVFITQIPYILFRTCCSVWNFMCSSTAEFFTMWLLCLTSNSEIVVISLHQVEIRSIMIIHT